MTITIRVFKLFQNTIVNSHVRNVLSFPMVVGKSCAKIRSFDLSRAYIKYSVIIIYLL